MAAWTVVLGMNVDDYKHARKIRKAIENMRGVRSVWASPERGLVEVYGTVDAYALQRRIWRKLKRPASVVRDGSAPYYYPSSSHPAYGCYSHQSPAGSYPYYAAGGYGARWSDRDPYGYAAHSTVPTCSIL